MPLVEALPSLTFLGHSTVLIELGGLRILTDPVLFDRVGLLRRVVNPLDPGLYARIDVALLSLLHRDHFDLASLRLLGQGVRLLVPAGAGALMRREGFRQVDELPAGGALVVGSVSFTATHAAHGGFPPPFRPRAAAVRHPIPSATAPGLLAGGNP